MSVTSKRSKAPIPDSYLALILKHPLRAVKTRTDYGAAAAVLDKLAIRDDLDMGEEQYLEILEMLITAYDDKYFPDTPDERPPLERLKTLLESSGTTPAKLQAILDASQSMVSMILSGQRELSKKAIAKLASHFKLDPGYFF